MQIMYNGETIAEITTNRNMTIEEALYIHGYDVNSRADLEKAYTNGFPAAYIDDNGNYQIDVDALTMQY